MKEIKIEDAGGDTIAVSLEHPACLVRVLFSNETGDFLMGFDLGQTRRLRNALSMAIMEKEGL